MSMTDQAELEQLLRTRPVLRKHHPHFAGDGESCDYTTGHCTNTEACKDCIVYQSWLEVQGYEAMFRGDA